MPSVRDLIRAVAAQDGVVTKEESGRMVVYQCEAPAGHVWACTGDIHAIRCEWQAGDPAAWRSDAIQAAIEDVAAGTAKCDDAECDYCHPVT